jgi:hypothetical protein
MYFLMEDDFNKLDVFKDIFNVFNIHCENESDLFNITLDFDTLKDPNIITKLYNLIPKYKALYNTSMLTCLHQNSTDKQKLPAVNFIRQILKCNDYKLSGYYISLGYNKINGRKNLKRLYKIVPIKE